MRIPELRCMLLEVTLLGLLCSTMGCKSGLSAPSMDWLSWGGKKPAPTALASASPKKPSSSTLPSPSATTGVPARGMPATGPMALAPYSAPASTGYGNAPTGSGGYYTGPYNTGPGPSTSTASTSPGGYPLNNFTGGAAAHGAAAGYQSPYQSPAGSYPAGDYRTADLRNNPYGSNPYGSPGSSSPAATPYGGTAPAVSSGGPVSDAWGRGSSGQGQVAPAGFGQSTPSAYPQAGYATGGSAAPIGGMGSAASPYRSSSVYTDPRSGSGATSTAGLSTQPGAYRPGSTARNSGSFGSTQTSAGTIDRTYGGTSNGSFPTGDAGSQLPATQPAYGGYSYPSTGQ